MLLVSCAMIPTGSGGFFVQGFGLVQLVWMIPIWALARKHGGAETAKGVLLGIGITLLLSAACWGTFLSTGISG